MIANKNYHNFEVLDKSFNGPLFIFGTARSGTTYLRRLVNSFPNVFLMYESPTIRLAHAIYQKEDILKDRTVFQRFLDRLETCERNMAGQSSVLFTQPVKFYDHLYDSFCDHRDFSAFCRELFSVSVNPGCIWGNKLLDREELKMLMDVFIHARFIVIIRDVRSVAHSTHEFSGGNYLTTALLWADAARVVQSVLDRNGDQRVMLLHYEDLVRDSKLAIERIASFIGLPLPSDFSIADKAHTKSIEKWRNHLAPRQIGEIEEICFNEMKHFGYSPEFAEVPRKPNQLRLFLSLVLHMKGRLTKGRVRFTRLLFNYKSLTTYLKLHKKIASIKKF